MNLLLDSFYGIFYFFKSEIAFQTQILHISILNAFEFIFTIKIKVGWAICIVQVFEDEIFNENNVEKHHASQRSIMILGYFNHHLDCEIVEKLSYQKTVCRWEFWYNRGQIGLAG